MQPTELQLKPFWPDWLRPTDYVGGGWEVKKQRVSQQYLPVDTVSSWPRGRKNKKKKTRKKKKKRASKQLWWVAM